ncbi:MAG: hypothetical protein J0I29_13630 [Rhizobiales bacterium]|nr:hypothetical protein [Hyphomicrobiales bacterium]
MNEFRQLLAVVSQHFAAAGANHSAVLLEAPENGEIAVGNKLAAKSRNIAGATLLLGRLTASGETVGYPNAEKEEGRQSAAQSKFQHYRPQIESGT